MSAYAAPLREMMFAMETIAGLDAVAALPGFDAATPDVVEAALTEAARLASEVIAPLNRGGDIETSRLENGVVVTPNGFRNAYRAFADGGWNSIAFDPEHGGQGMPWLVAIALQEMWDSANLAFSLCPMLTQGAVELLSAHGSDDLKRTFLPKMISGEWTGTMEMTEPQAGSDVGALRTRAVRDGDVYRLTGQKIFITWGDHDMADNIVHMVLARLDGAPDGVRGLSVFLVPKFPVKSDGTLGPRNDLRPLSLEHKLGIKASPTAVMEYGGNDGAIAYLIGRENEGIACMFTMMNNARLSVGLEGVAIGERAYQQARDFAKQRIQGRDIGDSARGAVAIVEHPDVRRMLLHMRANVEASRALTYAVAADLDIANRHPDETVRAARQRRVDLLIPVVKAWCTDLGVETASLGIQVHGGVGFIEETGAAQHYRDARITPIYEGTNGIQAMDLVRRKIAGDGGAAAKELLLEMRTGIAEITGTPATAVAEFNAAADALERAVDTISKAPPRAAAAGAAPFLKLTGMTVGGYYLIRSAAAAQERLDAGSDDAFYRAKVVTARFFAENVLPHAAALARAATSGDATIMELAADDF